MRDFLFPAASASDIFYFAGASSENNCLKPYVMVYVVLLGLACCGVNTVFTVLL